MIFNTI